jgi:hypothetical protein
MLKNSIQSHHAELLQHDVLRKRVMHIAQLLQAMDSVRRVLREHPEITDHLLFYKGMEAFFTQLPEDQPKIARLFELLKTSTFSSEPDEVRRYTFNYGRVLVALKLLTEIEEHLATPLAAVGEVDSYLALAERMATPEPPFCFPEYRVQTRPSLAVTDAWNPFVAPERVVANSVALVWRHGQAAARTQRLQARLAAIGCSTGSAVLGIESGDRRKRLRMARRKSVDRAWALRNRPLLHCGDRSRREILGPSECRSRRWGLSLSISNSLLGC